MRRISIFIAFLGGVYTLSAQIKDPELQVQAWRIEQTDLIDQLMLTVEGIGSNSRALLEQQSIKAHMMPVRQINQAGTELSYLIASCLEYYVNLDKNYKLNLSPDFMALNLSQSGKPISMEAAFGFLAEEGTISASVLPYGAHAITTACYNTPRYRIEKYLWLFREVTMGRQKVYETRKALTRGNPVLIELAADPSIRNLGYGQEVEVNPRGDSYSLVVVGFSEEMKAFEVMSCWGSRWANSGYGWVSYDDFGKAVKNGFVLVPHREN